MEKAKPRQLHSSGICLAFCLFPFLSKAGDTTLVDFKSFPHHIISMVSDPSGTIWFNSGTGLYTFNGKKIKQVSTASWRGTLILWKGKPVMRENLEKQNIVAPNPRNNKHREWAKFLPTSSNIIMTASDNYHRVWVTTGKNLYGFEIDTIFNTLLPGHSIRGILKDGNDLYVNTYSGIFKNQHRKIPGLIFSHGNSMLLGDTAILIVADRPVLFDKRTNTYSIIPFSIGLKTQEAVNKTTWERQGLDYIHASNTRNGILLGTSKGLFHLRNDSLYYTGLDKVVEYIEAAAEEVRIATSAGIFKKIGDSYIQDSRFPTIYFNSIRKIGNSWWATSVQGIWVLYNNYTRAQPLFKHKTLGNIETYCIEQDTRGFIWVSTTAGLYRFQPNGRHYESYLLSDEFNKRSSYATKSRLYFGTVSRLIQFDPRTLPDKIQKNRDPDASKWVYLVVCIVLLSLAVNLILWLRWKKAGRELAEKQKELSAQKDRFIAQLEAHIHENIATVTVESLSNAVGMNSRKLYRFMDSNYGLKPGDMIRNIKQLRVREVLQQDPETDLNELAQSVGYSTPHLKRLLEQETVD